MTVILSLAGCQHSAASPPVQEAASDASPDIGTPSSAELEPSSAEDSSPSSTDPIRQAVQSENRSEADLALDPGRHPEEMLRFFDIRPGMRVAELAAGGGYTTELLARVVGPEGQVYGQNTPFILDRFAEEPWSARLRRPELANVVRVDSELEAPLPADVAPLDAVLMVLFYHDTVWFETDRAAMNRAVFAALAPGGIYGIVDHAARQGDGTGEAERLHRIEESVVIDEVTRAGFVLEATADFLRNPDDDRSWSASPSQAGERRGSSDRFALRFVKPGPRGEPASP